MIWAASNFSKSCLQQISLSPFLTTLPYMWSRSSRQEVFCKKDVLRNFTKFTGKHLRQSLFFNKICGPKTCNFITKETLAQLFSCQFCEIFWEHFFFQNTPGGRFWWCLSSLNIKTAILNQESVFVIALKCLSGINLTMDEWKRSTENLTFNILLILMVQKQSKVRAWSLFGLK